MQGPRDFTQAELARYELAAIERRPRSGGRVIRVYCLRCGRQVNMERRDADPDGWWVCSRGCNTSYSAIGGGSRSLITPPARRA
jgi:hypothetical protein